MEFEVKESGMSTDEIAASIQALDGIEVDWGSLDPTVPEGTTDEHLDHKNRPSGKTVAGVLAMHEFGTRNVDKRSVLLATLAKERGKIGDLAGVMVGDLLDGMDLKNAAKPLGSHMTAAMRKRIKGGIAPALMSKTLQDPERAANATPLNDSGQILKSLHWRANGKGQRGGGGR